MISNISSSNLRYGKYRGKVVDNQDPKNLGRIRVEIADVYGEGIVSKWALPCVPYAGKNVGWVFIPDIGTNVWIEFEKGNTDYPIWVGCYWAEKELPASAGPKKKVLQTSNIILTIDDTNADAITIENQTGMNISINASEITLSNSSSTIKMSGNDISINSTKINLN